MHRCPRQACCATVSFTRSRWAAATSTGRHSRSARARTRVAGRRDGGVTGSGLPPSALAIALVLLMLARALPARAIDFYEIQIYQVQTAPYHHLTLELHSNTTTTATGQLAREEIDPYQIHETLEGTYGVLPWPEVGQYLCTA